MQLHGSMAPHYAGRGDGFVVRGYQGQGDHCGLEDFVLFVQLFFGLAKMGLTEIVVAVQMHGEMLRANSNATKLVHSKFLVGFIQNF